MGSRRIDEASLENIITESKASCNKGWLVELFYVSDSDADEPHYRCYLRNLYTSKKVKLPNLTAKFNYSKQILTAPPTEEQQPCFVLSLIENERSLLFCRLGDLTWSQWSWLPHWSEGQRSTIDDSIKINDKVYALCDRTRLFEIETQGDELGSKDCGPILPSSSLFCICGLVESCGELFAVGRKSIFDTYVYKMDFSLNRGEQVFKLSLDRCFAFLGTSLASFSAAEFGVGDNTIFFKETELGITDDYDYVSSKEKDDDPSLYAFNLADSSLSVWNTSRGTRTTLQDHSQIRKFNLSRWFQDHDQIHEEKFQEDGESSRWFQLPLDTQILVIQCLSSVYDVMNFRAVCKDWKSLVHPIEWSPNHGDEDSSPPFEYPWLMFPQGEKGMYNFFDPIANLMHSISIPELENCKVRYSHQGWLLVTRAPYSIFFFERFTKERIELPELGRYEGWFDAFCVSGTPTSTDWQICAISNSIPRSRSLLIYLMRPGREVWTWFGIDCSYHIPCPSFSNLVFDGECFCYLAKNGKFIYFKIETTDDHLHCVVKGSSSTSSFSKYWRQFLVCYQDELISVWIDQKRNSIDVFKLDSEEDEWVEVKSLDEKILYLSQTTSLAVEAAAPPEIKNTVQFSMFSDIHGNGGNISYSLKVQRFRVYKNSIQGYSSLGDLYDTKEIFLGGTWIQPLVQPHANWNI
ncbi:F-box protein [Corchorus olitorius]|uniref:F-box protein n=1 Tax=Corchorus olitorius TaxID=93759 RepID=A0A1R3JNJ3_9ROSI|nr:F-box protein [Corchorus olitorius]